MVTSRNQELLFISVTYTRSCFVCGARRSPFVPAAIADSAAQPHNANTVKERIISPSLCLSAEADFQPAFTVGTIHNHCQRHEAISADRKPETAKLQPESPLRRTVHSDR